MAEEVEFTEHLIELIHAVPAIWNKADLYHRDTDFRNNAFASIANRLGRPADKIKSRWESLRDKFLRDLKDYGNTGTGKPGGRRKQKWAYFDRLLFLNENRFSEQ